MEKRRNEFLTEVADHAASVLTKHGIHKEVAGQIGEEVADNMATNWGGQHITFPKDCFFRKDKTKAAIVAEFTGVNHSELARKYDLSVRSIYKIIKADRDAKKSTTGDNHVER